MVAIGRRVILTDHYRKRYKERVGAAPPSGQREWLENSIRKNRVKQI
jgi:hypothetical protein